jgi:hypothetical protein
MNSGWGGGCAAREGPRRLAFGSLGGGPCCQGGGGNMPCCQGETELAGQRGGGTAEGTLLRCRSPRGAWSSPTQTLRRSWPGPLHVPHYSLPEISAGVAESTHSTSVNNAAKLCGGTYAARSSRRKLARPHHPLAGTKSNGIPMVKIERIQSGRDSSRSNQNQGR